MTTKTEDVPLWKIGNLSNFLATMRMIDSQCLKETHNYLEDRIPQISKVEPFKEMDME